MWRDQQTYGLAHTGTVHSPNTPVCHEMTSVFTFIRQSVPLATATYPSLVTLVILRRKSTEFRLGGFHLRMSSHLPGLYGCGRGGQKGQRFGWLIAINTWLRCYSSETDNQLFLLLLLSSQLRNFNGWVSFWERGIIFEWQPKLMTLIKLGFIHSRCLIMQRKRVNRW